MASRDDDDDRDDDRPRRRDDEGDRARRRDRDDDEAPPRRRRDREYDDDDYEPRAAAAPAGKSNAAGLTLSIIGLVFGTLSLLFSFIPCVGALALWPGIVALVISGIGFFTSVSSKALPITAAAVSALSIGFALYQRGRVEQMGQDIQKGADQWKQDMQKAGDQWQKQMEKERERLEKERQEREKKNKTDD